MKTHRILRNISAIVLLITSVGVYSQSYIEGKILDKKNKEPLPFATIKIISNNNYYTITNEDGNFQINDRFLKDSIEVRFIGFKTKKIALAYFNERAVLYLSPNVTALKTVVIVADKKKKDETYELLYSIIEKYREAKEITKSKAFLTLTSSAKTIPIEIIEGFYNSEQSLSKGIADLQLKSGRFGQNKSFAFYSLNNTDILKDFQLFQRSPQILPSYPGNFGLSGIKGKYNVKIDDCLTCDIHDSSITFLPKKLNGRLFSGTIIFNEKTLSIKQITLFSNKPITEGLRAISEKDQMTPKEIKLVINFNPNDYRKIQSINFDFSMFYTSQTGMEIVKSNSFLYFYEYDKSFSNPYFTNKIEFNNDYDKITALQATDEFWKNNYQFPQSFNEQYSIKYFEKSGYLINYKTEIPSNYFKYVKPAIIVWDGATSLQWENIQDNKASIKYNEIDHKQYKQGATKAVDSQSHSISDLRKGSGTRNKEAFNFSFSLDGFETNSGETYRTKTVFDRNSSFCLNERNEHKLIYVNMLFNIYEIYNRQLKEKLNDCSYYKSAIELSNAYFKKARTTIEKMKLETENGTKNRDLMRWDEKVKEKLKELESFQTLK